MASTDSSALKVLSACLVPVVVSLAIIWLGLEDFNRRTQLAVLVALSGLAFWATQRLIEPVSKLCLKAGLYGIDINKAGSEQESDKHKKIPESLGLVSGVVYLTVVIMLQPLFHSTLGAYNAALVSVSFTLLLGFADDVLDLRWSYKVAVSFLAALPALVAYATQGGLTCVVVPRPAVPLVPWLLPQTAAGRLLGLLGVSLVSSASLAADGVGGVGGVGVGVLAAAQQQQQHLLELGVAYYVLLLLMAVFMTNSINILAGVNGLEVGQSLLIALAFLLHCALQVGVYGAPAAPYLLAFCLLVPFVAVSLALLWWNWYPSRVFVGDSYTYFAGMTFAVTAMLGQSSKTMMLFFLPQLINFGLSLPQLTGIIPCPRHRLPRLNKVTGRLEAIPSHLNLINQLLRVTGPLTERQLCLAVLYFQIFCIALGFLVRYQIASFLYS